MKAKSNDEANQAKTLAGSVRRASKSIVWNTSKAGKTSMALLTSAGRRNQKTVVKGSKLANSSITKGGIGTRVKVKNALKKPPARKPRPTLIEQIKAPMTAAEARRLTEALHASDRPTRKLPPRP
ncbi:hypothetical protein SLUN_28560 [Streptomyces lunaelactis]|uniref:Uncharacterized protein n=1 Tax=Streptomyces lunaelactis TaxID=1535768 RepID=A0A2R4T909_9ACTN|nr:hypothetical protein [Streptomyces lunaelactis]AVZ75571.1 hypothetical protein SLUN_28560 [Streptomyces lunaelactis]NUK87920.1 hypothetical protein [Streptomyces lunaelactis]